MEKFYFRTHKKCVCEKFLLLRFVCVYENLHNSNDIGGTHKVRVGKFNLKFMVILRFDLYRNDNFYANIGRLFIIVRLELTVSELDFDILPPRLYRDEHFWLPNHPVYYVSTHFF